MRQSKSELLILRISAETKKLLADAAEKRGESITALVTRGAIAEAKKARAKGRAESDAKLLWRAYQEAQQGGKNGYRIAGRVTVSCFHPKLGKRRQTKNATEVDEKKTLWRFYDEKLKKFSISIPARRRNEFIKGVLDMTARKTRTR